MSSTKALMISAMLAAGLATTVIAAPPASAGTPSSKSTASSAASAAPRASSSWSSVKGAAGSAAPAPTPKDSSAGAIKACPAPKPAASGSKAAAMPPQMSQGAAATSHPSPKPPSTGKPKTARDISSNAERLSTSISMYPATSDTRSTSFSEYITASTISPSNLNNNRDTTLKRVVKRTPSASPLESTANGADISDSMSPVAPVTDAPNSVTGEPQQMEPTARPGGIDDSDPLAIASAADYAGPTASGAMYNRLASASGFPSLRMSNGTGLDGVAPPYPAQTGDVSSSSRFRDGSFEGNLKIGIPVNSNSSLEAREMRVIDKRMFSRNKSGSKKTAKTTGPYSAQKTSTKSKGGWGSFTDHYFKGHATTPGHSSATSKAGPHFGGHHVGPTAPSLQSTTHNGTLSNQHNSPSFEHGQNIQGAPPGFDQTGSEPYAHEPYAIESNHQTQPDTQVNEPSNISPGNNFENAPQHQDQGADSTQPEPLNSPNAEPQTQSNDEYETQAAASNVKYAVDEQVPNSPSTSPQQTGPSHDSSNVKFVRDAAEEDYDQDTQDLKEAYSEDF
ncbi:hypothetical protein AC579_3629 [Pseudocercospora musae]|uniref:Uncharacterized protein n=1 Tax=Pseudocercospora musae TaxID=113226 RepID=A0A139ISM8_9PEZI|nr:hypothetical protein AC579_3629 [Pseudocercospora musae]KXT17738.1 hypothetical protein AC579_3629 [Pseudocercospora musae]KXT17739.1 hypothetical protein AC579_3629 [Pseudocercospora musae]KXT17742.1 hypothetical protein AC579_3629 [Pseudocercospora musae]KXT17743.1 hypothetical protein AC579_3629 [Pseudocercospora musae]